MQRERWPKWPEQRQSPLQPPRSEPGLSEAGAAIVGQPLRVTSVTQCRILSSEAGGTVSELDISKSVR